MVFSFSQAGSISAEGAGLFFSLSSGSRICGVPHSRGGFNEREESWSWEIFSERQEDHRGEGKGGSTKVGAGGVVAHDFAWIGSCLLFLRERNIW